MKKIIICIVLISLILIGCSTQDGSLRIGIISPSVDHLPLTFGMDNGKISQAELKIRHFTSGWEVNEALVAGKIDVAILPFTYVWLNIASGYDVKTISFFERESDGIIASKDIKSPEDLHGRKIGVLRSSTLDILAEDLLSRLDISAELVYLRTPSEMAAALTKGDVDALSYYVPSIFKFDERFHILYWYSDAYPAHPCCNIAANAAAIEDKSEALYKLLEELQATIDMMEHNQDEVLDFTTAYFGLSKQEAEKTLKNTRFVMGLDEDSIQFEEKMIRIMYQKDYISKKVDRDEVYDQIFTQ